MDEGWVYIILEAPTLDDLGVLLRDHYRRGFYLEQSARYEPTREHPRWRARVRIEKEKYDGE